MRDIQSIVTRLAPEIRQVFTEVIRMFKLILFLYEYYCLKITSVDGIKFYSYLNISYNE